MTTKPLENVHPLFTNVLFSVTHRKKKWLEIAIKSLQIEPHSCQYPIINHLDEIQGPLNEWIETRFKLVQENGEKIWFEAVTSDDSTLGKEHKKLNFTH